MHQERIGHRFTRKEMIKKETVYKIGRLGKAHGVKGEISFQLDDDVFDRVDADYLVLDIDGILVPFFIEEYRFKTDSNALMKFEGIDTQERARELTGCDVYFPRELSEDDEENISWAEIIGYSLLDVQTGQEVGKIASVDDSTINILFELENGKLIPASEELITNIDTKKHQIKMNLPKGILEL
jgi:16S rRNA processing protein RimM